MFMAAHPSREYQNFQETVSLWEDSGIQCVCFVKSWEYPWDCDCVCVLPSSPDHPTQKITLQMRQVKYCREASEVRLHFMMRLSWYRMWDVELWACRSWIAYYKVCKNEVNSTMNRGQATHILFSPGLSLLIYKIRIGWDDQKAHSTWWEPLRKSARVYYGVTS